MFELIVNTKNTGTHSTIFDPRIFISARVAHRNVRWINAEWAAHLFVAKVLHVATHAFDFFWYRYGLVWVGFLFLSNLFDDFL